MTPPKPNNLVIDLGLIYAAAIWGSTFFLVKDALAFIHPVTLVGYRFFIAAALLGAILLTRRHKIFTHFRSGFILGVLLWLLYIPQTIGLGFTSAANSGFITGLFIVFVPLFSLLFFRQAPKHRHIISVLLAVTGLWFLTGGLSKINSGDLLTLITAMAYAAYILVADKLIKKNIDPLVLSFQQFLTVGLLSLLWTTLLNIPISVSGLGAYSVILFLALFPTLSAFAIQLVAQKTVNPAKISIIFCLEPVFAALFAWTLGGEQFVLIQALGGLLIVVSMILFELPLNLSKQKALLS